MARASAWFQTITRALRLAPAVLSTTTHLVKLVEADMAGAPAGSGAQKKALVLGLVDAALQTADPVVGADVPHERIVAMTGRVVDLTVTAFNLTGLFRQPASRGQKRP
jgi:hypothetical protein